MAYQYVHGVWWFSLSSGLAGMIAVRLDLPGDDLVCFQRLGCKVDQMAKTIGNLLTTLRNSATIPLAWKEQILRFKSTGYIRAPDLQIRKSNSENGVQEVVGSSPVSRSRFIFAP